MVSPVSLSVVRGRVAITPLEERDYLPLPLSQKHVEEAKRADHIIPIRVSDQV